MQSKEIAALYNYVRAGVYDIRCNHPLNTPVVGMFRDVAGLMLCADSTGGRNPVLSLRRIAPDDREPLWLFEFALGELPSRVVVPGRKWPMDPEAIQIHTGIPERNPGLRQISVGRFKLIRICHEDAWRHDGAILRLFDSVWGDTRV